MRGLAEGQMNVQMHGHGHLDTRKILGAEGAPAPCLDRPPSQAEHWYARHYQKQALWEGDQAQSPDVWFLAQHTYHQAFPWG